MNCTAVRSRLSEYLDCDLSRHEMGPVAHHLEGCTECDSAFRTLRRTSELLSSLPPVVAQSPIAPAVMERVEIQARGLGMHFLLKPVWLARPLMLPSLVPATLVVAMALSGAVFLGRSAEPAVPSSSSGRADRWDARTPASGTESNPLFPSTGVAVPQLRNRRAFPEPFLTSQGESSVFLETVVARDGSVSAVTLIDGDTEQGRVLADALRRERFVPVRLKGRPVAVSLYRLFSHMEVRLNAT